MNISIDPEANRRENALYRLLDEKTRIIDSMCHEILTLQKLLNQKAHTECGDDALNEEPTAISDASISAGPNAATTHSG